MSEANLGEDIAIQPDVRQGDLTQGPILRTLLLAFARGRTPLRVAEAIARLGGRPEDPRSVEEHEDGTNIQTFQRGYLLNGKPIRPAKVVVAKQV